MKRIAWTFGIFAALVVVLVVGLVHSPEKGVIVSPFLGKPAPQFTLPLLNDPAQHLDVSQLKGGWHLVNVWGTWCVECRAEHAQLLAIQREGRVPIVGINWRDEDASALQWLAQLGNPYSIVGADRDGRVAIDWGVYAAPESFLVSPEGIVVEKQIGAMTPVDWQTRFLPHVRGGAQVPAAGGSGS